jgi:hypothetical protein
LHELSGANLCKFVQIYANSPVQVQNLQTGQEANRRQQRSQRDEDAERSDGVMEWCYFRLAIFDFGFKGWGNFKTRSRAQKKIMVRFGSNRFD